METDKMNSAFKMRTYKHQELALLYLPHCTPQSAGTLFSRWLRAPGLRAQLEAVGYQARQRIFTPKQVAIIVDYLGEP